jgi:alpha-galactosidase
MGYNTWNDLGCDNMNEQNIKAVADAIVEKGLAQAGFEYLNLDDCWMSKDRDSAGRLQGDLDRFPSGIKSLADYVHSKGLKFGIYSDRGTLTCAGYPASYQNEALDAQTFADWGVDYLKEDNCNAQGGADDKDVAFAQFGLMRDSLNATGRPIFFSVCGGGGNHPWDDITFFGTDERGGGVLGNSWRISADVTEWQTCQMAARIDIGLGGLVGAGSFNDPDMLLGTNSASTRYLGQVRSRTQFNLWAVLTAPLLLGSNIVDMNAFDVETYTNAEVIAVNQDELVVQGTRVRVYEVIAPTVSTSVWARRLADGSVAVVFMNNLAYSYQVTCDSECWNALPFVSGTQLDVRDLWAHAPASQPTAVSGQDYVVQVGGNGGSEMFRMIPTGTTLV